MSTTADPEPSSSAVADAADAALQAARALESTGRVQEALTECERALRLRPDPALAQRIVSLRHAAAGTPAGSGLPAWPRQVPDPFPGVAGPPEIEPPQLSAATVGGAIRHHGCLIVRGLLAEGRALSLLGMVEHALAARDRAVDGVSEPGDDDWYRPFEPGRSETRRERHWVRDTGGMLTADSPVIMCEVLDALADAGALAAIRGHLGEPAWLSFSKSVLRRVRQTVPTWHQDGAFLGEEVRTVDVWLSLSHCGPGTGAPGLDLVPRRFDDLLDTQTHGAVFPKSIGQGLVDEAVGDEGWTSPRFAPGDAILFDERFVHRSGVGEDFDADRYAIESWFFAASHFPGHHLPILA